ncbi:MAG TPA: hypothetical protein VFT55_03285 [Planctomycetota bacterium]|nr:hypothetical protein [Planctomycetota bacterium]
MRRLALWSMALWLCGVGLAQSQDPGARERERTVQLTVTSVIGRSVYLDHGRDVGLLVGTIVRLFPPGAPQLEVEVRSVSQTSARAELPPGMTPPPVGTRGEATVAVSTGSATPAQPKPAQTVVQHPPWTRQEDPRHPDQPLLVPTFSQRPDERPVTFDGRLFASGQWNQDRGANRSSDYTLLRLGVRAEATNLLGAGEIARFAGELDDRRAWLENEPDESDQDGRIDLASVAFGTEAWAPTGVELGRFFSPYLPEIGLVDGVEAVGRFEGGLRVGGGVGAYPLPLPDHGTGEDIGAHAFVDYVADEKRSLAFMIGGQKTWHEGAPDRDLLLLRGEWRPADQVWLLGSARVDFYTGSDKRKSSAVELTEVMLQARWDGRDAGAGLLVSHFRWPDLKRTEYAHLPDAIVRDGEVDRFSLNGSLRATSSVSVRGRVDYWHDQDRDGASFGFDADWRDVIGDGSYLYFSAFHSEGGYTSGPGWSVSLRDQIGVASWRVGYRWHHYVLEDLVTGTETYTRQSIEAGISWPIADNGDFDLAAEHWFGDGEDAYSIGFYLQWRF